MAKYLTRQQAMEKTAYTPAERAAALESFVRAMNRQTGIRLLFEGKWDRRDRIITAFLRFKPAIEEIMLAGRERAEGAQIAGAKGTYADILVVTSFGIWEGVRSKAEKIIGE